MLASFYHSAKSKHSTHEGLARLICLFEARKYREMFYSLSQILERFPHSGQFDLLIDCLNHRDTEVVTAAKLTREPGRLLMRDIAPDLLKRFGAFVPNSPISRLLEESKYQGENSAMFLTRLERKLRFIGLL